MSVCDGSDDEDLEVKHEPMDRAWSLTSFYQSLKIPKVTTEKMLFDAQLQKFTGSRKWWNAEYYQFLFSTLADCQQS